MKFNRDITYSVQELVNAWKRRSLVLNSEYQRGATWTRQQQQGLIDSIFREYPLPQIFLELKESQGLGGEVTKGYEIIDGQQRILSMVDYLEDKWPLLSPQDRRLRLPLSLRAIEAPWAEKLFSDLAQDLSDKLKSTRIGVTLVEEVSNPDQVRDLFIRLQSGTSLTRQQIRDAWPGALGPQVERWAGKLDRQPAYKFFDAVDGRGTRYEEDDPSDRYVRHRTTCAQLCALLLSRAANPFTVPNLQPNDVDATYHEYTEPGATNIFGNLSAMFADVEKVIALISNRGSGRKKIAKLTLFALAMYIQDVHRADSFKLNNLALQKLANATSEPSVQISGRRISSGRAISSYYEEWRKGLPEGTGVQLDPRRTFSDIQKNEIRDRDQGLCGECGEQVVPEEAEYDHFPVMHRDGGPTEVENGRLVHAACHPRGRPAED